jgi:hypothetical protein
LWVFGLILALTAGNVGGPPGGGNGGDGDRSGQNQNYYESTPGEDWEQFQDEMSRWFERGIPPFDLTQQDVTGIVIAVILVFVMILITIVLFTILRYVAETALIRMVDEYERTGIKVSVRKGFQYGWSPAAWRLFLIDLLFSLPGLLMVGLLILVGFSIFLGVDRFGASLVVPGIVGGIGAAFLIMFLIFLYGLAVSLLRNFIWRASVLEETGVFASIRNGFRLAWKNWKSAGLMWLVMVGLGILYSAIFFIGLILVLPLFAISLVGGTVIGGLPALLVAAISSLFLNGYWPWIIGVIVGLPLFLLVLFLPALGIGSFEKVFTSSVWTLAYRELKALGNGNALVEQPLAEPPVV